MRLTTKGRYAVTAMLDLALHSDDGPVRLAEIAKRQDISQSYLEQLFAKLRRRQLITSVRGPGGGYRLGRTREQTFVTDIIDAVDESVDATNCGGTSTCQDGEICLTHHLWSDLNHQIHDFLSQISLADLVAREDVRAVSRRQAVREAPDTAPIPIHIME